MDALPTNGEVESLVYKYTAMYHTQQNFNLFIIVLGQNMQRIREKGYVAPAQFRRWFYEPVFSG